MDRYELNISLAGHHWARVALPGVDAEEAKGKAQVLDAALREYRMDRGMRDIFTVDLTRWTETGRHIDVW